MKEKREKTVTSEGKIPNLFLLQFSFLPFHSNLFSIHFLPFFVVCALIIYTKIPRKLKKAICSIFSLFFWSAQNFSYCSWPYFLHSGGNNWLSNPFEWLDFVSSFKIGVLEPIVYSLLKEIRSLTVRKIFLTQKREKKSNK